MEGGTDAVPFVSLSTWRPLDLFGLGVALPDKPGRPVVRDRTDSRSLQPAGSRSCQRHLFSAGLLDDDQFCGSSVGFEGTSAVPGQHRHSPVSVHGVPAGCHSAGGAAHRRSPALAGDRSDPSPTVGTGQSHLHPGNCQHPGPSRGRRPGTGGCSYLLPGDGGANDPGFAGTGPGDQPGVFGGLGGNGFLVRISRDTPAGGRQCGAQRCDHVLFRIRGQGSLALGAVCPIDPGGVVFRSAEHPFEGGSSGGQYRIRNRYSFFLG